MADEAKYDADDMDHMVQIETLIARMQKTRDQFGNTCVYIRRGGLAWGAVALNRRADDEKHGVFDLQAQHDRDMRERAEQIQRLIADREQSIAEIARLREVLMPFALFARPAAMDVPTQEMLDAGIDAHLRLPIAAGQATIAVEGIWQAMIRAELEEKDG